MMKIEDRIITDLPTIDTALMILGTNDLYFHFSLVQTTKQELFEQLSNEELKETLRSKMEMKENFKRIDTIIEIGTIKYVLRQRRIDKINSILNED